MSPYPDDSGDPYNRALIAATTSGPGSVATANAIDRTQCLRSRSWRASQTNSTAASGARLGRIRIASAENAPAATAAGVVRPSTAYVASVQNAAAGTSLICDLNIIRNVGLVAVSHAAASPAVGDSTRDPTRNVAQTSTAPVSGTTRNALACPNAALKPAISSGRPRPVAGAIAA